MRRSEREIYRDILRALVRHGPLRVTHIMHRVNVCHVILKQYLDFLIQQNLVEEQTLGKKSVVYATTERGYTALKNFRQLYINLPIAEKAGRIPELLC